MINAGIVTVSYIIATILFILALGGLSNQETARRGNWYGIIGMAIALIATILGVVTAQYIVLLVALLIGGSIGLFAASRVQMTQMPELVAILHSLVGMAAVLVGFANLMGHSTGFAGVELTIHNIETYLGILIGAVTFSGSVVAFGKLSGPIRSDQRGRRISRACGLISFYHVQGIKLTGPGRLIFLLNGARHLSAPMR